MTGKDLLESMEYVDPKLIEAAENPQHKKVFRRRVLMTVVAAASLAFVIGISSYGIHSHKFKEQEASVMMTAEAPAYDSIEAEREEIPAYGGVEEEQEEAAEAEMAAVESADMITASLDDEMISKLDQDLKEMAEPEKSVKEIAFSMKQGIATIYVTITQEQAELLARDELLADSLDGSLTQYAAYIDEQLSENGIPQKTIGIVFIEGQTIPYVYFSAEEVTAP
jgi:hypothetical protein